MQEKTQCVDPEHCKLSEIKNQQRQKQNYESDARLLELDKRSY